MQSTCWAAKAVKVLDSGKQQLQDMSMLHTLTRYRSLLLAFSINQVMLLIQCMGLDMGLEPVQPPFPLQRLEWEVVDVCAVLEDDYQQMQHQQLPVPDSQVLHSIVSL